MAEHNELGKKGEKLAVEYLQKKGYKILETNWFYDKAEVDIIAEKNGFLAVIEVKTRSSLEFGLPQEFVKPKKIQLLVKAINHYVEQKNLDLDVRFDIIAIHQEKGICNINHISDAFFYF